jgi:integrase
MGSIEKRGRKGHEYYIIRYVTYEPDGSRKQHKKSCRGMNQAQSRAELTKIEAEINAGTYIEQTDLTLSEHLAHYLVRCESKGLSPATIEGYQFPINKHILPALGRVELAKLKPAHIQQFYDALHGKGLSAKTIRNIHGVLHAALNQAVRMELITRSPADRVDVPKKVRPTIHVAEEGDRARLVAAIIKSKYRVPILIALGTGLRRGEILALKWSDLDEELSALHVQRAVVQTKGKITIKGTKPGRAAILGIPPTLLRVLQEHRKVQEERKAKLGDQYVDGDWICAQADGRALTPGGIDRAYYEMKKAVGIEVTLHGLRHTLTMEELTAGIPSEVVSKRRIHANISVTHDIYGHVPLAYQQPAVDVAEKVMNPKPQIRIVENS